MTNAMSGIDLANAAFLQTALTNHNAFLRELGLPLLPSAEKLYNEHARRECDALGCSAGACLVR